jgi:hypothetical protein
MSVILEVFGLLTGFNRPVGFLVAVSYSRLVGEIGISIALIS